MIDPRKGAAGTALFEEEETDLADSQEFDRALTAGTEAIARGEPAEARVLLEKALRYKPRNQRARNLLGLSLFKLGELERAEEIYRSLIEDHPADPTLRVNLGLVFLKATASTDAVRCFETALDLAPDHQKAQNYLGLALAQRGELARAREWFLKAGNQPMAERMLQALTQSPIREVAQHAEAALEKPQPFQPATEEPAPKRDTLEMARPPEPPVPEVPAGDAPVHTPPIGARWVATAPASPPAPPVAPRAEPAVLGRVSLQNAPEPTTPPAASPGQAASEFSAPSALAHYTSSSRLSMPPGDGGFAIGATEVLVQVRGEMLTRLDGLVASWGQLTIKPELKRFRGRATDKPFGDGARRMLRASGEGRFVVSRDGRHFTALELGDEQAYFREEIVFAFEQSILFENGRVPSKVGHDLHLVQMSGRGRLLLATVGVPRSVDVNRGEPLRIPMEQLVGWHGPLIQPRLVPIVEDAPDLGVALELAGEGRALLDVPSSR